LRTLLITETKTSSEDVEAIDSHLQMAFTLGYEQALRDLEDFIPEDITSILNT